MRMKKIVMLIVLMLFLNSQTVYADTVMSGEGTEESPFLITEAGTYNTRNLDELGQYPDVVYYKIANDIVGDIEIESYSLVHIDINGRIISGNITFSTCAGAYFYDSKIKKGCLNGSISNFYHNLVLKDLKIYAEKENINLIDGVNQITNCDIEMKGNGSRAIAPIYCQYTIPLIIENTNIRVEGEQSSALSLGLKYKTIIKNSSINVEGIESVGIDGTYYIYVDNSEVHAVGGKSKAFSRSCTWKTLLYTNDSSFLAYGDDAVAVVCDCMVVTGKGYINSFIVGCHVGGYYDSFNEQNITDYNEYLWNHYEKSDYLNKCVGELMHLQLINNGDCIYNSRIQTEQNGLIYKFLRNQNNNTPDLKMIGVSEQVRDSIQNIEVPESVSYGDVALPVTAIDTSDICPYLEKLTLPNSLKDIQNIPTGKNRIVYCYTNSVAHQKYANSKTKYSLLDGISITNTKIKLKKDNVEYGKNVKCPKITVKLGNKTLKEGQDYIVYESDNKFIGTQKVRIRGIKKYTGEVLATYVVIPQKIQKLKLKVNKKKQVVLSWKNKGNVDGYEVVRSQYKNKKYKKIKKNLVSKKYTDKKVKKNKKYYYKVRCYKIVDGKKYYSKYSKPKAIMVK